MDDAQTPISDTPEVVETPKKLSVYTRSEKVTAAVELVLWGALILMSIDVLCDGWLSRVTGLGRKRGSDE